MQSFDNPAVRPAGLMCFARRHGRSYMMRSEKRGGYTSPNGRRPRRRRGGFFYGLFTLLLSILLWPVGMIMLWRRRLRWTVSTKLLTTIISLFLSITLFGYGLTVQTDDARVTKVQDTVNDFLDNGAVYIANGYSAICDSAVNAWDSAVDLGNAVSRTSMLQMAELIDQGVTLANDARETISELLAAKDMPAEPTAAPVDAATDTPETTETPKATLTPTNTPEATPSATLEVTGSGELPLVLPDATPDPESAEALGAGSLSRDREFVAATPTPEPTADPTIAPTETPKPTDAAVETDAPEMTDAPTAEAQVTAEATAEPTKTPEPTGTPEPTNTPEPSPSPEIDPSLMPKPAGEAVVYFNPSGVGYHMASSCNSMSTAAKKTLAEGVAEGKRGCRSCGAPSADILDAEAVVWVDKAGYFHLTDECADFEGIWSLKTLDDALAAGNVPCKTCKADQFMAACGRRIEPTPEPTLAPTATPEPTPVPTPTATPEPKVVTPSRALKSAGEALVYHSSNGSWYHTSPDCSGMGGASAYPLSECIGRYKRCRKCDAPLPELVDEHCLWMDEQNTCHTTDECPAFNGKWSLILRDEALDAGYVGCKICNANEYLEPNTLIQYLDN